MHGESFGESGAAARPASEATSGGSPSAEAASAMSAARLATTARLTTGLAERVGPGSRFSADEWETEPRRIADLFDERDEPGVLPALLRDHPLAVLGLGVAAGLVLGLGGDRRGRARLERGLKRGAAIAATAGAAVLLERLLASRPPMHRRMLTAPRPAPAPTAAREPLAVAPLPPQPPVEHAPDDALAWLVSAGEAQAFPGLPAELAAERVAALWERLALESLPPRELSLAGDRVARLAYSHPQVLAPDVMRLFGVWPVLASADATLGAQVAWTAGQGGPQRIVRAMDPALRETGMVRTVAEAFLEASLGYTSLSEPPLSNGVPAPPSTVYPHWPRDIRHVGPPSPPETRGPGRRDVPGPVHLGAAAPQAVRPGNQFLAFFAAYTEAYTAQVREKLMQEVPPEAVRLDKKRAAWEEGTRIVVVPVSNALEFDPPQAEFTWDGRFAIEDFTCTVRGDAPLGSAVLEFQVFARVSEAQVVQFEKVRVTLGIVEDAPVYVPRLVTQRMAETVFASYASEDRDLVSYKLGALPSLGIDVYEWRLKAAEGEILKDRIESEIRGRDVFFLFWSRNAQASEWVRWELEVALDSEKSGRPSIIPQLLENLDDERDFPPELLGRQFFNPFFFLDRPETIRAQVNRIRESGLARAPLQAALADASATREAPAGAPTADSPGGG